MAQPSSQEITVGAALASILSALGTASRENCPCCCPGRFSGALVSPGRKQISKSQGFWQFSLRATIVLMEETLVIKLLFFVLLKHVEFSR